ncbi:MAG: acetyl-coenzyme A synthetase, partial [Desulfuromonadales bacterium]|nr:acetyl-coenzyme A synthetase [Desulfuromonadales bacterium]
SFHPVPETWQESALIDADTYREMYRRSLEEPEAFWSEQAERFLTWDRTWDKVCEADFHEGRASWFSGGRLNVAVNCIDRHLAERGDATALIWEGDE